jgi:hypothetical protein
MFSHGKVVLRLVGYLLALLFALYAGEFAFALAYGFLTIEAFAGGSGAIFYTPERE